jgi:hypothetical protein
MTTKQKQQHEEEKHQAYGFFGVLIGIGICFSMNLLNFNKWIALIGTCIFSTLYFWLRWSELK